MPNIKSAQKRLRSSAQRRQVNLPLATRVKSAGRAFRESVEAGEKDASQLRFRAFCSALDKAAKRGVIKKNQAIRSKSRAAARLRALS